MAKIENRKKQNPKLQQSELSDGRASLYLEYYIGRTETPVIDEDGKQVFYTEGAMVGKPKFRIKHTRKKENLNLYIWSHPRTSQERQHNKVSITRTPSHLPRKYASSVSSLSWRTGKVIASARRWTRTS